MLHSLVRRDGLSRSAQLRRLFLSASTSASWPSVAASSDPRFMVEYLAHTCGFTAGEASKVSKSLPYLRSTEKLDAVLGFLRSQGFDGANLRKIISWKPGCLGWDVETNLAPNFSIFARHEDIWVRSRRCHSVAPHPHFPRGPEHSSPQIEGLGKSLLIEGDAPPESPEV